MTNRTWLAPLIFCMMPIISGCDGGLFGTGDGGDLIDVPDQIADGPVDDEQNGSGDSDNSGPNTGAPGDGITDSDALVPVITSFTNTTPSGLPPTTDAVPGIKLVNLSAIDLAIQTQSIEQTVQVQAGLSGDLLPLNTGNNVATVSSVFTDELLLNIDPLTAAADSVTTALIVGAIEAPSSAYLLDTRVSVLADNMSLIRVVSLIDNTDSSNPLVFTLEPTADNAQGTALVLTDNQTNSISISSYELSNAGTYTLSVNSGAFSPVDIKLEEDNVYTLIITGNPETPVYLEIDTLLP